MNIVRNFLKRPVTRREQVLATVQTKTIGIPDRGGGLCVCDVIWIEVDGFAHFAFLNRINILGASPTNCIESLATETARFFQLKPERLKVWDVDRWADGNVTCHLVRLEWHQGVAAYPVWLDEPLPSQFQDAVTRAFGQQDRETGSSPTN